MAQNEQIYDLLGNKVATIQSNEINSDELSIELLGSEISPIANSLNKNIIALTQTFANPLPPKKPLIGQQWHNTADRLIYIWNGITWKQSIKNETYPIFVKYHENPGQSVLFNELNFDLTANNTVVLNMEMQPVRFSIDAFDFKKIIIKEAVDKILVLAFFKFEEVFNPKVNKMKKFIAESGQSQFDVRDFINFDKVDKISLKINDFLVPNSEFAIYNGILNLGNGLKTKSGDEIRIWKYGGSYDYRTNLNFYSDLRISEIKIPKIMSFIDEIRCFDMDYNQNISPIDIEETDEFVKLKFLDAKKVKINMTVLFS